MIRPPAFSAFGLAKAPVRHLSVQRMVEWAFAVEHARLDLPDRRAPEERGFGFGMEHVLMERARVGCQIDGGRGGFEIPVHWDAETLAARLVRLPAHLGGIPQALQVAQLGRAGLAPDWMPGARPACVPVDWITNRHGRHPKTEIVAETFTLHRGKKVRHEWRCVPVTFDPHPAKIEAARLAWTRWRAALEWLRDDLRAQRLRDHAVTDELPPEAPWRNE